MHEVFVRNHILHDLLHAAQIPREFKKGTCAPAHDPVLMPVIRDHLERAGVPILARKIGHGEYRGIHNVSERVPDHLRVGAARAHS